MTTTHVYRAHDGVEVNLVCPWGSQSGNIPPPFIEFAGRSRVFTYVDSHSDYVELPSDLPGVIP